MGCRDEPNIAYLDGAPARPCNLRITLLEKRTPLVNRQAGYGGLCLFSQNFQDAA